MHFRKICNIFEFVLKSRLMKNYVYILGLIFFAFGCSSNRSSNSSKNWIYDEDGPGPRRVFIEGGTFTVGASNHNPVFFQNDVYTMEKNVTSFYMDENEVTNGDWLVYLNDLQTKFPNDFEVYYNAIPDTLVWRNPLSYNEPYVDLYLRHESFRDYPVVGVTWEQANDYAQWRTDSLHRLRTNNNTQNSVIQPFRLPTEAEWEYAAMGLVGNNIDKNTEILGDGKIYPWNGIGVREIGPERMFSSARSRREQGQIRANFKLSEGNYSGIAGSSNDGGVITAPVKSYWPNNFGLYDMAGNVNEWVEDVYRELTFQEAESLNPFRGSVYLDKVMDPTTGEVQTDKYGRPIRVPAKSARKMTYEELMASQNDSTQTDFNHDMRGYRDEESNLYGQTTLVNNKSRVYKGGSWNDQANWLNPAARRFMQQDESSSTVGFRLVMTTVNQKQDNSIKRNPR